MITIERTSILLFCALAVAYLAACAALYFFQRSLIYYPQPSRVGTPAGWMRLKADGADLAVSVRAHPGPNALVYFGGNAEDVSASLQEVAAAFPDRAIYMMHYRGYGGSDGTPSQAALQQDAIVLYDKVLAAHPNIVVMGRSLGSGLAVHLASQRTAQRLILITPYDSIEGIAAGQFPVFPVRWLLRDKFDSGKLAAGLTTPTLIVVAENDNVIPRASSDQLYARFAKGVATFKVIPRTGHNTISDHPDYLEALRQAQ